MSSNRFLQRGKLAVYLVVSTVNGGESCCCRGIYSVRVGGAPRLGEFFMNCRQEWGGRWREDCWRLPGRYHSSDRPWAGSSGAGHSRPRYSTAFDRARMSSASGLGPAGWPPPEPPHSSASDVAKDMESSAITSSSDVPNETKSLAAEEGPWSLRRDRRTRGGWGTRAPLAPSEKDPLLCCFYLLGEKGNGRAEGGGGFGGAFVKIDDPR